MTGQATPTHPRPAAATRYDDDYWTWVQEQVAMLRAGRLDALDVENVAEELSDVGKAVVNRLRESVIELTRHLLMWDQRPAWRSADIIATVTMLRRHVRRTLDESPGVAAELPEIVEDGYAIGRLRALGMLDLPFEALPEACPYTFDEIMSRELVLEPPPARKLRAPRKP